VPHHCHMVDPALKKVLAGSHRSGVAIPVGHYVGGRRLVGAVAQLGASTGKVSFLTAIKTPPIYRVLHWPLDGWLPLPIMTSQESSLVDVGALYELVFQSLVALHGSLGSLLELRSVAAGEHVE
jgi:hypothetical protein